MDPELRPSHSWRHTWKIAAKRAGIEEIDRDAVCGHEPASVGQDYTPPDLQDLAGAMKNPATTRDTALSAAHAASMLPYCQTQVPSR